jgi:hypothetical protein
MYARKCDRCGKGGQLAETIGQYEPSNTRQVRRVRVWQPVSVQFDGTFNTAGRELYVFDLCQDCTSSLVGWIAEGIKT